MAEARAQKPTGGEDAVSALTREQPVTAAAATPTPVNNESAGAEGAEFIAQDPPGNDDLLWRRRVAVEIGRGRVNCLGRSADPGYKGNRRSSAETAPYELR